MSFSLHTPNRAQRLKPWDRGQVSVVANSGVGIPSGERHWFGGAIRITAWTHCCSPACRLGSCSAIKLCFLENPLDWKLAIVELVFLDLVVRVEMSKLEEMIVLILAKDSARIPCSIQCGCESDCQSWGECKALYKPDSLAAFSPTLGVPGKIHLPNFCWACLWKQPRYAVGREKRTLATLKKGNR